VGLSKKTTGFFGYLPGVRGKFAVLLLYCFYNCFYYYYSLQTYDQFEWLVLCLTPCPVAVNWLLLGWVTVCSRVNYQGV